MTGEPFRFAIPALSAARAAAFSPDSRQVAFAHQDGSLLVYDLDSGQALQVLARSRAGPGPGLSTRWQTDRGRLPGRAQPTCRILDADTGQQLRSIALPAVGSVAWSPDGTTLATTCGEDPPRIFLWDAATGQRKAILEGVTSSGLAASFHPSGTLLASNGWEGRLRLWDAALGRQILSLTSASRRPGFSRDGRIFVQWGNEFSPWQVDPALEYRTLVTCLEPAPELSQRPSIHRDGRILAVGTDRGVVLWDLARGTELAFLPIGMAWHSMFDVSGDLLTNGAAGVLRWPIRLDADRAANSGSDHPESSPCRELIARSPRTGRAGSSRWPGTARHTSHWRDRTITIGPLDDCRGVSVSPDGQWLATGSHPDRRRDDLAAPRRRQGEGSALSIGGTSLISAPMGNG